MLFTNNDFAYWLLYFRVKASGIPSQECQALNHSPLEKKGAFSERVSGLNLAPPHCNVLAKSRTIRVQFYSHGYIPLGTFRVTQSPPPPHLIILQTRMESRRYTRHFKEQVIRVAMDGVMPVSEIATHFGVTVTQVMRWKTRRVLFSVQARPFSALNIAPPAWW